MELSDLTRLVLAALISLGLSYHGIKKKSLSASGAIAAVFVGFTSFACSYRFGIILILFYYVSSKLTKVREDIKAKLEDDYAMGGQRNWIQVFANSILATSVCIAYCYYFGSDSNIDFSDVSDLNAVLRSKLLCMYVAHYACAAGDTWASELGVLSKSRPRLVTSLFLRTVPPGTNGGMSVLGTSASAAGGAFIGLIFWVMTFVSTSGQLYNGGTFVSQFPIVFIGLFSGIVGSLYDSLLGATLQASYYSRDRKCIVKDVTKCKDDKSIELICGSEVLSNEAVNFVSILFTMVTVFYVAPYCWQVFSI